MSSADVDTLTEMGFSKEHALKALKLTGNQGVEPAMEWLIAHAEEMDDMEISGHFQPTESMDTDDVEKTELEQKEKTLQCNDCQKIFKSQAEKEIHVTKTNHVNFTDSTEKRRKLTEEERKEHTLRLLERLRQIRLEREEREKKEAADRDKIRIKSGKETTTAKKRINEEEIEKLLKQRKREKIEEKLARERIKQLIEHDKIERRIKFGMPGPRNAGFSQSVQTTNVGTIPQSKKKDYLETKIQIRLTNGDLLTETFGSKEPLAAVRLYVQNKTTDGKSPFSLMTNFPKKRFTEEDYKKPLNILGLVPSAVVIVSRALPASSQS